MVSRSNDDIRELILTYFYNRNKNATSERGKKGSQVKISDVKGELKSQLGLTQQEVISNLTYLIDRRWVVKDAEQRSFNTGRGTAQPAPTYWYGISADGIEKIEGESAAFKRKDTLAGINVTALASTIQIGDGNYVNVKYRDLHLGLENLREGISNSAKLDDAEKVQAIADIETVKMQLMKADPEPSVLAGVWSAIERAGIAAGFSTDIAALGMMISRLVSS